MQEKLLKFVEQSNVEIGGRSGFIFNEKKGQDKLREREYNSELMRLYVVGGGGCMIQNFGEYDKSRVTIVRDICATAKGYEAMTVRKIQRNGGMLV